MNYTSHNESALFVCKYVFAFICNRQKLLKSSNQLYDRMALIEEYKEWITEGITNENILYLITTNEISDK